MTKTILVSGSSRGIGFGILNHLKQSEYKVIGNSRNSIPRDFKLGENFFNFDCSNLNDTREGLLSILDGGLQLTSIVANVGDGSFSSNNIQESWDVHLRSNLLSQVFLIELGLEIFPNTLKEIIVISSIAGLRVIPEAPVQYSASKAALEHYVRSKSVTLAPLGITINCVAPGNILFSGSTWDKKLTKYPDSTMKYINSRVPMKKFGNTSDVASLVEFLLNNSNFITGQTFIVDGGQSV